MEQGALGTRTAVGLRGGLCHTPETPVHYAPGEGCGLESS